MDSQSSGEWVFFSNQYKFSYEQGLLFDVHTFQQLTIDDLNPDSASAAERHAYWVLKQIETSDAPRQYTSSTGEKPLKRVCSSTPPRSVKGSSPVEDKPVLGGSKPINNAIKSISEVQFCPKDTEETNILSEIKSESFKSRMIVYCWDTFSRGPELRESFFKVNGEMINLRTSVMAGSGAEPYKMYWCNYNDGAYEIDVLGDWPTSSEKQAFKAKAKYAFIKPNAPVNVPANIFNKMKADRKAQLNYVFDIVPGKSHTGPSWGNIVVKLPDSPYEGQELRVEVRNLSQTVMSLVCDTSSGDRAIGSSNVWQEVDRVHLQGSASVGYGQDGQTFWKFFGKLWFICTPTFAEKLRTTDPTGYNVIKTKGVVPI